MGEKYTKRIKCKHYFQVNSSEPIDPDDLKISVKNENEDKSSNEYNPLFLPTLWAYFQTIQTGLLTEKSAGPWEEIIKRYIENKGKNMSREEKEWIEILEELLGEEDTDWTNNLDEIYQRVLRAYQRIRN